MFCFYRPRLIGLGRVKLYLTPTVLLPWLQPPAADEAGATPASPGDKNVGPTTSSPTGVAGSEATAAQGFAKGHDAAIGLRQVFSRLLGDEIGEITV